MTTIDTNINLDLTMSMLDLITTFKKEYSNSGDANYLRLAIVFTVMESLQSQILNLKSTVAELEKKLNATGAYGSRP